MAEMNLFALGDIVFILQTYLTGSGDTGPPPSGCIKHYSLKVELQYVL